MELDDEIEFINRLFENCSDISLPIWARKIDSSLVVSGPIINIIGPNTASYTFHSDRFETQLPESIYSLFDICNYTINLLMQISPNKESIIDHYKLKLIELSRTLSFNLSLIDSIFQTKELCINLISKNSNNYKFVKSELIDINFNIDCIIANPLVLKFVNNLTNEDIAKNIEYLDLNFLENQNFENIIMFLNKSISSFKYIKPGILSKHEWEYIKFKYFV